MFGRFVLGATATISIIGLTYIGYETYHICKIRKQQNNIKPNIEEVKTSMKNDISFQQLDNIVANHIVKRSKADIQELQKNTTKKPDFTTAEELDAHIQKKSNEYFENLKKQNIKTQIKYNPWDFVTIKSLDNPKQTNDKNAT